MDAFLTGTHILKQLDDCLTVMLGLYDTLYTTNIAEFAV